jgi:hypothetical protein
MRLVQQKHALALPVLRSAGGVDRDDLDSMPCPTCRLPPFEIKTAFECINWWLIAPSSLS